MSAKDLIVRPVSAAEANALVRRVHYSGKVVNNSQIHMGVFWRGSLEGAMQFGPSLDKRKIQGLVDGTGWNEFIELNRMAFGQRLPRNSESRAIAVAMRLLRKHAPHLRWVVSFADGTQCGDGTIYRASGFVLTGIKENNQIWKHPDGRSVSRVTATKAKYVSMAGGAASMSWYASEGFRPLPGFQLRYLYFLDPSCRERLTVPMLPFSEIDRRGARMYLGEALRAGGADSGTPTFQVGGGGANPTPALQDPAK